MKKILIPSLFVLVIIMINCNKQEHDLAPGQVKFGIERMAGQGGRINEVLKPAALLLSISNVNNNIIETDKKMPLYGFGDSYMSESLQLLNDSYLLTKFLVLDTNDKIIYAAPLAGSQQAQYVNNPLPLGFKVTTNNSTLVSPQVLAIEEAASPESFGYACFGFDVVDMTSKLMMDEIIFDNDWMNKYKLKFAYSSDHLVKSVDWSFSSLINSEGPWTPIFTESRVYSDQSILNKIIVTPASAGPYNKPEYSFEKNYTYNQYSLSETTSNQFSYTPFSPVNYDQVLFQNYDQDRIVKIAFKKTNYPVLGNNLDQTILFEYDTRGNIKRRLQVMNNKVIKETILEYDTTPNPLYKILETDALYSTFSPINLDIYRFSKNNVIKAKTSWPDSQIKPKEYFIEYTYDKFSRPLESVIHDKDYPDVIQNKVVYKFLK